MIIHSKTQYEKFIDYMNNTLNMNGASDFGVIYYGDHYEIMLRNPAAKKLEKMLILRFS
jgi:hypothetical protein